MHDDHSAMRLANTRSEMSAGVQEVLPCGANGQALHRGHPRLEDLLYFRTSLHRLRYLRQEMSLCCYQHHQLANKP